VLNILSKRRKGGWSVNLGLNKEARLQGMLRSLQTEPKEHVLRFAKRPEKLRKKAVHNYMVDNGEQII